MRKCYACGERVVGRADKKFCSDHCRSNFHNNLNRDRYIIVRQLNNKLRRNYTILVELTDEGCFSIPLKALKALKFDPSLFTGWIETEQKLLIYDISFSISDDGWVMLKKDCL